MFNLANVPPALITAAETEATNFVEGKLGLTIPQAAAYVAESKQENPQFSAAETRDDSAGKFKHGLRDGELPVTLGSSVDVLWPAIEPYAYALVDAAVAGGA